MQIRLNGWQGIGILVSSVWLICFAVYFLYYAQDTNRYFREARKSCDSVLQSNNDVAILIERTEDRVSQIAENRAKWTKCRNDARKLRYLTIGDAYQRVPLLFVVDIGTVAFGWLVAWLGIVIVRRKRRPL